MKKFKPSETELPKLKEASRNLGFAKAIIAAKEREKEAAEKVLYEWLKNERGLDVNTLAIGEFVNIEGVLVLEIGKMNKFDQQKFQAENPELYERYKRDVAVKRPKPTA